MSVALVVAFSLACHNRKDSNGTTTIEGTIETTASVSKAGGREAASTLTGVVTNITTTETYQITVTGSNYKATIIPGTDIKIEFKSGSVVALSRVFTSAETASSITARRVNAVTHIQAKMALAAIKSGVTSLTAALKQVNKEIFGSETATISETGLTVASLQTVNPAFAARVAIIARTIESFVDTTVTAAVQSLYASLAGTFDAVTIAAIATNFTATVNALTDATVISTFASVFEGAKNLSSSLATTFTTVSSGFSANITAAIETAKASPVFSTTAVDTVRKAAPGVLFQYTFPTATTTDVLGMSSYAGVFTTSPNGPTSTTADSYRTIKYIPSQGDAGTTFTYTLTATAANGKTVTSAISIVVGSISMTQVARNTIGSVSSDLRYQPLGGLRLAGDYAYLVAQYEESRYRLERYKLTTLITSATAALAPDRSWDLPSGSGSPTGLDANSTRAFVATQFSGVLGYDTSLNSTTPDYVAATFSASDLTIQGSKLYGYYNYAVKSADTDLKTVSTVISNVSSSIVNFAPDYMSGLGTSYIYLAGSPTNTLAVYDISSNAFISNTYTSAVSYDVPLDPFVVGESIYALNSMTSTELKISSSQIVASTVSQTVAVSMYQAVANATYAYGTNGSSDVFGVSIKASSNSATATNATGGTTYFSNALELDAIIWNIPEGISTNTAAYLLTVGQNSVASATMTATWSIRADKVGPQ